MHGLYPVLLVVVLIGVACDGGAGEEAPTTGTPTTSAPPTSSVVAATTTSTSTTAPQVTMTESPTTTTTTASPLPSVELVAGLYCRDVEAAGYGFEHALAYWVREGRPDQMDADHNGIPCETVYAASDIDGVLHFDVDKALTSGQFCRDAAAAGYGFNNALAYWVREGAPDRMDADRNGLPCETVYAWKEILGVMAFDGSSFASPEPPPSGTTIGAIVDRLQVLADDRFAERTDVPPGVVGPAKMTCEDRGRVVAFGDVFACEGVPQTTPDLTLDSFGQVFLVLSDDGRVAGLSGTDMPSTMNGLLDMYEGAQKGLFCRDLFAQDVAHPFGACCTTGTGGYWGALAYWFLEGRPERMDADGNGIPCETLFDPADVTSVWSGEQW